VIELPRGRDQSRRYFDASVDVPGPAVDRLAGIAAENSLYVVIGVVEGCRARDRYTSTT
jgi:hypothetical protein